MDDRLWDEVWERTLGRLERHQMAVAALRREVPDDPLQRRLVPELARRWRRSARNQALFHLVWVVFWGAIHVAAAPEGSAASISFGMALFSVVVIAVCGVFRRYLIPVARVV